MTKIFLKDPVEDVRQRGGSGESVVTLRGERI